MLRNIVISALLMSSSQAFAVGGWDDIGEISKWNDDTLLWAQEAHPTDASLTSIEAFVPAPPEELWCIDLEVQEDCELWEDLLAGWLKRFLALDTDEALPVNLPLYPKLCPSVCDVF